MNPEGNSRFEPVLPDVRSRLPAADIRRRLAAADVVVLDADECMMPGFAQIELGHRLARDACRPAGGAPRRPGRMLRLAARGAYLYGVKLLPDDPARKNRRLQVHYGRALLGIDRAAFDRVLPGVWKSLYPGVAPCLRRLARSRPLGVITLGLDCLIDGLPAALADGGTTVPFLFLVGNRTVWRDGRFAGLAEPIRHGPQDKENAFKEQAARHHVGVPLVVGHNNDETRLCALADAAGGLSIGIGARPADRDHFHVVLPKGAWDRLAEFLDAFDPS